MQYGVHTRTCVAVNWRHLAFFPFVKLTLFNLLSLSDLSRLRCTVSSIHSLQSTVRAYSILYSTMSLVQCIFQNCLTIEDENSTHQHPLAVEEYHEPACPQNLGISREVEGMNVNVNDIPPSLQLSEDSTNTNANAGVTSTEEDADIDISPSSTSTSAMDRMQHSLRYMVQNIFKSIEEGFNSNSNRDINNQYDQTSPPEYNKVDKNSQSKETRSITSPLKIATVYKSMGDIPSIALEQVVLPGSPLQRQMSIRLQSKGILTESAVDECVICMEPFEDSNPRIPTRCGCGENRTFFHLPCLYQWAEKCRECPSCRERLSWKEF